MSYIGGLAVPVVIFMILFCGILKKQRVFDLFMVGAKDGISVAFSILPALVGLVTAVAMFRASGAMSIIVKAAAPVCSVLGFPEQAVPLALMRPVSGSGALSILSSLLKQYGPDSFTGRVASVLQGSTETTFYTVTIYFGAVGVTKTRHTIPAALMADFTGMIMSVLSVRLVFG